MIESLARRVAAVFFVMCAVLALYMPLSHTTAQAQDPTPVPIVPVARITSPIKEQRTRGTVIIQGAAISPVFSRYEIAYASEPNTEVWTIIGGSTQPIAGGVLQSWNTRPLPDGSYALRLQVFNTDGTLSEVLVRNLVLTNQAAGAAVGAAVPTLQPETGIARRENEIDQARNTLDQLSKAVNRIPAAFTRGVRLALIALGALILYGLGKQLLFAVLHRYARRPIDYGK
jgi:hypothetical protein